MKNILKLAGRFFVLLNNSYGQLKVILCLLFKNKGELFRMDFSKIEQSINLYKNNFGVLFLAGLIVYLLSGLSLGILLGPLLAGMIVLVIKLVNNEKAEAGDVFNQFNKFTPTFLVGLFCFLAFILVYGFTLLLSNLPFIGFLFGILPFLVILVLIPALSTILFLSIALIIDKNLDYMEAIKQSFDYIQKAPQLLLYTFIVSLLSGLGGILCGIGFFLTAPLLPIAMTLIYLDLTRN